MRTTVDMDAPVLKDLKKLQQKDGKSLGRLISDLLAQALGQRKLAKSLTRPPKCISKRMSARIDLTDPEALYAGMESEPPPYKSSKSR